MLTRVVRLGYESQIEILGATDSCVVGEHEVPFFMQMFETHLRMICTLDEATV